MKKIMLQAGHAGVTSGATGAPAEQELNLRIRTRLSQILISKGFQLYLVDAHPPQNQLNQDFDLFLALHGDANVYGTGGGFVDHPEPSTDLATAESQRIDKEIEGEYFKNTGIVNHPERSNANTKFYYMWSQLSAKTPCVIIEMGVVQDAHDKVILSDTERVASAIARGVCKSFGIAYDAPVPPTPPPVNWEQRYNDEVKAHDTTKKQIAAKDITINALQGKIDRAKADLA
jgi:N-acetylmuramoyl-L-alanine amidase